MKWDLFGNKDFIGFNNYQHLATDLVVFKSFFNTILIWILNVIPRLLVALIFAYILSLSKMKQTIRDTFMMIFYLPNLITAASIGALFSIFLDWQTGTLNHILFNLGLITEFIDWLNYEGWARFFTAFIIAWMWSGYAIILLVAGMGTISHELYECAILEGAGHYKIFTRITLPLVRPTLVYILITSFIGGMQNFDIPKVLTDGFGSPDNSILTVVMHMYNHSFNYNHMGYGASISIALFIVIIVISIIFFRYLYKTNED
jgi:multiple sugar transport system permease protein